MGSLLAVDLFLLAPFGECLRPHRIIMTARSQDLRSPFSAGPGPSPSASSVLCSTFDAAGRNIKYPCLGVINATAGSVCHDEISLRIGVPCPKGITCCHQVIQDEGLPRVDRISAIAALTLCSVLIEINGE